ncbi:MAG: hypothetical protein LC659_16110, partial [Myxococcales bacterium]|nr:hypothetical protein [Myxococcales bacterium]
MRRLALLSALLLLAFGCRHDFELVVALDLSATAVACQPNGGACGNAESCCSGRCVGAVCVENSVCGREGDTCAAPDDCCSFLCGENAGGARVCKNSAGCASDGQPCDRAGACCSLMCDAATASCAPGLCSPATTTCNSAVQCCG